jgi:DNA-binding HxlR family transcriptional regulator
VPKSYEQYCTIAAALDLVGDRWTLLVLRELSFGEQRFTDLRSHLPGIATNLLTERLKQLEASGLVEQRELPPPAARTVYALTGEGRRIRPVLRALSRFGLPYLDEPVDGTVRPAMAVHGALGALVDSGRAEGLDLAMEFHLDGQDLALRLHDGRLTRPEEGRRPDLVFRGSAAALVELCRGASEADVADRLEVTGSARARRTLVRRLAEARSGELV